MSRRVVYLTLVLALASALCNLFQQFQAIQFSWPIIALWTDPTAQQRALVSMDGVPYDLLRASGALLPRDATVLLVTNGQDVRHREYTTFHRALYALAPRALWWVAPAPHDDTWESRWWIAAPLTVESLHALAHEQGATHVLFAGPTPSFEIGQKIFESNEGALFQLDEMHSASITEPINSTDAHPLWFIQLGAAIAISWLLGDGLLRLITRESGRVSRIERMVLAWALGMGVTTLAMLWLNAAGLTLAQQIMLLALLAIAGAAGLWRGKLSDRIRRLSQSTNLLHGLNKRSRSLQLNGALLLSFCLLVLQIAFVSILAVGEPLRFWDSWVTWGMKARTIFIEGRISPSIYLDASRAVTHLDYPLLVPLGEAWLYGWLDAADDRLVGVQAVLFYLALLGVCYTALRRWGSTTVVALSATTVIATLAPLANAASGVFADVPLALFGTIAVVYLVDWSEGAQPAALLIAAFAAGLMPWVKREGWLLLMAVSIASLVLARNRRAWLGAGALMLSALLLAGPWSLFMALNAVTNADFLPITWATFQTNFNRLPAIAWRVLLNLINPGWNFVWVFFVFYMVVQGFRWARAKRSPAEPLGEMNASPLLALTALLYLSAIGLSYIFSNHLPYQQHIVTSIDRLSAHVAPLAVLWLARCTSVRPRA